MPLECVKGSGDQASVRVRIVERDGDGSWALLPAEEGLFMPIDKGDLLPEE